MKYIIVIFLSTFIHYASAQIADMIHIRPDSTITIGTQANLNGTVEILIEMPTLDPTEAQEIRREYAVRIGSFHEANPNRHIVKYHTAVLDTEGRLLASIILQNDSYSFEATFEEVKLSTDKKRQVQTIPISADIVGETFHNSEGELVNSNKIDGVRVFFVDDPSADKNERTVFSKDIIFENVRQNPEPKLLLGNPDNASWLNLTHSLYKVGDEFKVDSLELKPETLRAVTERAGQNFEAEIREIIRTGLPNLETGLAWQYDHLGGTKKYFKVVKLEEGFIRTIVTTTPDGLPGLNDIHARDYLEQPPFDHQWEYVETKNEKGVSVIKYRLVYYPGSSSAPTQPIRQPLSSRPITTSTAQPSNPNPASAVTAAPDGGFDFHEPAIVAYDADSADTNSLAKAAQEAHLNTAYDVITTDSFSNTLYHEGNIPETVKVALEVLGFDVKYHATLMGNVNQIGSDFYKFAETGTKVETIRNAARRASIHLLAGYAEAPSDVIFELNFNHLEPSQRKAILIEINKSLKGEFSVIDAIRKARK